MLSNYDMYLRCIEGYASIVPFPGYLYLYFLHKITRHIFRWLNCMAIDMFECLVASKIIGSVLYRPIHLTKFSRMNIIMICNIVYDEIHTY